MAWARSQAMAQARTVRLPSEFDFRTQSVLFLPQDMPDPLSPDFNDAAARKMVV